MNSASPELKLVIQLLKIRWQSSKMKFQPQQIPYILLAGVTPNAKLVTFSKIFKSENCNTAHELNRMIMQGILTKNHQLEYSLTEKGQKIFDLVYPQIKDAANQYRKELLTKLNKPLKTDQFRPQNHERNQVVEQIVALREKGFSERSIGRQINLPKSTVHHYLSTYAQVAQNAA